MAPLRNTSGSGHQVRKPKNKGQSHDSTIPDLFTRAFHECRRRKPHLFPANHESWTEEHLHGYLVTAWQKAGSYRQKFYRSPEDGLSHNTPGQYLETEPISDDAQSPSPLASSVWREKAPAKPRTKRTAASPPPTQTHPATPTPLDDLEHMSPLTTPSTCSSVSIPLRMVIRSTESPLSEMDSQPQAEHSGGAIPSDSFLLETDQRDDGAMSSEAYLSSPFVTPSYVPLQPSNALCSAASIAAHTSMWRDIGGSVSDGGNPIPHIDPSLLDVQRQIRDQMSGYYPSMHPSLGYAHMSSAAEHWPWR